MLFGRDECTDINAGTIMFSTDIKDGYSAVQYRHTIGLTNELFFLSFFLPEYMQMQSSI